MIFHSLMLTFVYTQLISYNQSANSYSDSILLRLYFIFLFFFFFFWFIVGAGFKEQSRTKRMEIDFFFGVNLIYRFNSIKQVKYNYFSPLVQSLLL